MLNQGRGNMTTIDYEVLGIGIAMVLGMWGVFKYFSSQIKGIYSNFDRFKDSVKKEYVLVSNCKIIDSHRNKDINRMEAKLDQVIGMLAGLRLKGDGADG